MNRDPAYEGDEPMESAGDYERALAGHAHLPELVKDGPRRTDRVYVCAKCGETLYEVPRGVGEFVGAKR